MHVTIVGAGLSGLATACHLVGAGHEVLVLEAGSTPGGRAGQFTDAGYTFDTGPTVLTMVDLLAEPFAAAGARLEDHVTLHRLDPAYRATFADGSELRVRAEAGAMIEEIAAVCGGAEAAAFERFVTWLGQLYKVELDHFIARNFDSPLDFAHDLGPLVTLVRLGGLRKLSSQVGRFFSDDRLRRLFSFQALYAGLSPFEALAIYAVIAYMDTVAGVWFPQGGMHQVAVGLAAAANAAGVTFRYDTEVTSVTAGHPVTLRLAGGGAEGEELRTDAVVLSPDLPVAYTDLLDVQAPRAARKGRFSPSCLLWLVGMRGDAPEAAEHHNIHFGGQWKGAFADLDAGRSMRDPSLLVSVPSRTDPGLAPPGGHVLYVLEPVPNLDGTVDWSLERPRNAERLAGHLDHLGYGGEIEVCHTTDPLDWRDRGMARGTPFALAHLFRQSGPFRPNNVDRRLPGVVFTGSGTVPGVGVPMVLISGRLAAERVEELARDQRGRVGS